LEYLILEIFMAIAFDDLQLLIEIVDCGSFSQAAARRGWSQPQVSQRIGALEQQVGAQLFRRHRRGAIATPACETFLPSARLALAALDSGLQSLQGVSALPKVMLASLPSLAPLVFGPILLKLADAPMEIRCTTDHSSVIMEMLMTDRAQLGFVLKCPAIAGIQLERLCLSPIIAVAHAGHPIARDRPRSLTLADIANARLAPQFCGPECDDLIQRIRHHRIEKNPIHAIQPSSAAIELALEHGFITFMPEIAVRQHLKDGRMVKLNIVDLPHSEWDVMVAWRSGKRADASKQAVLKVVRAMAADWATAAEPDAVPRPPQTAYSGLSTR
jgi:DNA-binding transcriptional LysR family regulator